MFRTWRWCKIQWKKWMDSMGRNWWNLISVMDDQSMLKNYRLPSVIIGSQSIALHWLFLIMNFYWSINKAFYIICDSLVFSHQNVVSIHVNDKSSNFFVLKVITLANRSHVAVHFFSNRSQVMLKCVKKKWNTAARVTDVLTMFWHLLWSITKHMHSNMESLHFLQWTENTVLTNSCSPELLNPSSKTTSPKLKMLWPLCNQTVNLKTASKTMNYRLLKLK